MILLKEISNMVSLFNSVLVLLIALLFSACSKSVESKTQYIFKKSNDKAIIAEFGNVKITNKELLRGIYADIYDLEKKIYDLKMNRLKAVILQKLMESDPNRKGLTNDQFLEKYIAKKIAVSNKEINAFVKLRKIPKEQLNDMVKGQIKKFLTLEKKKKAVESWMGEKTKKSPVTVYFDRPSRPVFDVKVTDADPSWGNKNAKVTVVEFSDFQCPFCSKAAAILKKVKAHYGNKIRVVFKNFPLPFHPNAKPASLAALCANEQGSTYFWKYYNKLFENQSSLDKKSLVKFGKDIGLDWKKLESCLDSKKFRMKLQDDMKQAGDDLNIKSTPTFYVNGQLLNGALPFEVFQEVIDEQLSL